MREIWWEGQNLPRGGLKLDPELDVKAGVVFCSQKCFETVTALCPAKIYNPRQDNDNVDQS